VRAERIVVNVTSGSKHDMTEEATSNVPVVVLVLHS